jgi:Flp pilus assembly protein TadG
MVLLSRIFQRIGVLGRQRRGVAAVEFAIGASFLIMMVTGVFDFGQLYSARLQLVAAVHSGAAYAATNGFNANGIVTATTTAANLATLTATPAPSQVCACPNGNVGMTVVACGTSCAGGGDAGTYVRVNAQASYTFIFPLPRSVNPLVMTSTALARIQ